MERLCLSSRNNILKLSSWVLTSLERRIENAFAEQYVGECDYKEISQNKIVLLIDDFHYARNKDDILDDISDYEHVVLVVDDVFTLDLKMSML